MKNVLYYVEDTKTQDIKMCSRDLKKVNNFVTGAYQLGHSGVYNNETLVVRSVSLGESQDVMGENHPITRRKLLKRDICIGVITMFGLDNVPISKELCLLEQPLDKNNIYQIAVDGEEGKTTRVKIEFSRDASSNAVIHSCSLLIGHIIKRMGYKGEVKTHVSAPTISTLYGPKPPEQAIEEVRHYIDGIEVK